MRKYSLIFAAFCLLFVFFAEIWAVPRPRLKIGDAFPGFYLKDLNGNSFYLKEQVGNGSNGRYTGIIFSFCAYTCKPCRLEIPELEKLSAKYQKQGLGVILINVGDNQKVAQNLASELKTSLPMLLDRYGVVLDLVGHPGLPHTVMIDNVGRVRYLNTSFSEKKASEIITGLENEIKIVLDAASGASSR
ncbi:MAG: TlpA disulfide reductase family protein [Candidatus Latescibacterota bacterium]